MTEKRIAELRALQAGYATQAFASGFVEVSEQLGELLDEIGRLRSALEAIAYNLDPTDMAERAERTLLKDEP